MRPDTSRGSVRTERGVLTAFSNRVRPIVRRVAAVGDALVGWLIRGVPGGAGQRIRYAYYRFRLAKCGKNVRIDEWVIFHNPDNIEIGNDVWIMSNAILVGPADDRYALSPNKKVFDQGGPFASAQPPRLRIGNEVQVGHFAILNGVGGLTIGTCVTLSARVAIYSGTHLAQDPQDPSSMWHTQSSTPSISTVRSTSFHATDTLRYCRGSSRWQSAGSFSFRWQDTS